RKIKNKLTKLYKNKNWQDILKNRRNAEEVLSIYFNQKNRDLLRNKKLFPIKINPYYASLVNKVDDGIWRQAVPHLEELYNPNYLKENFLNEKSGLFNPTPCLLHRYPTKALIFVSNTCFGHCRHCFRNYSKSSVPANLKNIFLAIDYIDEFNKVVDGSKNSFIKFKNKNINRFKISDKYILRHSKNAKVCIEQGDYRIRDVLLSGGDPLMLDDDALEKILKKICNVKTIDIVRIGTRCPVLLPQRITKRLIKMLRKYSDKPIYIVTQFNHPAEITPESIKACNLLRHAGIYIKNQSVLLKGVNDDIKTLKKLFEGLINIGVDPYYVFHPMMAKGTNHLRIPLWKGLLIIRSLRGYTSGFTIPTYMASAPLGKGKVPLPEGILEYSIKDGEAVIQNYEGNFYKYYDPIGYPMPSKKELKKLFSFAIYKKIIKEL
ncbi:MAG: radical SAM protein, partial [Nanoarchaeota archaeon]|nr:radical SAM protein [Nanoarchaeota archaeon]MBU1597321.1 radical SAM protein [Nanoarchaeota archaeon]MBU2443295.1 radical SAM protein [Nanoarchaeota archaeon]